LSSVIQESNSEIHNIETRFSSDFTYPKWHLNNFLKRSLEGGLVYVETGDVPDSNATIGGLWK